MKVYVGLDLHSNNVYMVLLNEQKEKLFSKRLPNEMSAILSRLSAYQHQIAGIVVESTYNWYWLADGLMAEGYPVYLANPTAVKKYEGLKYQDDKSDAEWLALMLLLNILPQGYIYPKEQRGLRELLRKRLWFVQQQTTCVLSLQSTLTRYRNVRLRGDKLKQMELDQLKQFIDDDKLLMTVSEQHSLLQDLVLRIGRIEKEILKHIKVNRHFRALKKVPGIGDILAMTILIETGDIQRFQKVGHYASYCRCVDSKSLSNGKKKGDNNRKCGNKYLAWAYMEAANFAIRYYPTIQAYYQKKLSRTHKVVALKTIASKLCRACYHMLKHNGEFDMQKLF